MTEPDVSDLLTVQQAIAILDAVAVHPATVRVPLAAARELVLAADLAADRDYPPFDKSLMDGYAVRAADVANAPVTLRLIGEIAAGQQSARPLASGDACAIMTGAPIPPGADGVVPVEDATHTADTVAIGRAADPARFIARRGHDVAAGQIVLRRGTKLEAAQLAVAATIGAHALDVHPRPRAAVLSTGDELIDPAATPSGSQIRNSNGPMLVALLQQLGCEVTDHGIARDDPAAIRAAMEAALETQDVLFVSGGMSMGAYDYVPRLLVDMGFSLKITKLRIKPGKPFVFATRANARTGTVFVFGLPGNPVSGFACTLRLASRLLARLAGHLPEEHWIAARTTCDLPVNGSREFYQPVTLAWTEAGPTATPLPWKGSADLFTLAVAHGLMVRAENEPALRAGAVVRVLPV